MQVTAKFKFLWARLHANYWFFPALFVIMAAVLAVSTVALDRSGVADALNNQGWLVPVRPNGASDILTVMAGSMIGVASTVFSITIVAVSYASGTYGPRLLTNFLEDRGNQLSLATFIGSFVYALIVLRSVRAESETPSPGSSGEAVGNLPGFAPQLSLLVAYILMGICVGVLVYFLNHVPTSIRINSVLQGIGKRLLKLIENTYPNEESYADMRAPVGGEPLLAQATGYVQLIDFVNLAASARKHGAIVTLRVRTGDFVHPGLALADISGCDVEKLTDPVRDHLTIGAMRTPDQDPQFLIDELVEIGLRALSPGINDPFTAVTALHWLGAATAQLGRRDLRKDVFEADAPDYPVIPRADDFDHYLRRGFGSMRSAVAASPVAALVMFDVLLSAALPLDDQVRRTCLRTQARLLIEQVRCELCGPDLDMVEARFAKVDPQFYD